MGNTQRRLMILNIYLKDGRRFSTEMLISIPDSLAENEISETSVILQEVPPLSQYIGERGKKVKEVK